MSKIGKVPIKLPNLVEASIEGRTIKIKGPKGSTEVDLMRGIEAKVEESMIKVTPISKKIENVMAYWGLTRALINNAVKGVSEGFSKELELVGIGYRVEKVGDNLKFAVGYSHPVEVQAPEGISFEVKENKVKVLGIDRQLVGQISANIRSIRKPGPYKGKGIKYSDEVVKRKAGKAAKSTA